MPLGISQLYNSLSAGPNINIYQSGSTLIFSAATTSVDLGSTITGVTNIGGGVGVFSAITSNILKLKTFSAGTNITLTELNGLITISSSGSSGSSYTFSAGTGLNVSNIGGLVTYSYTGSSFPSILVSGITLLGSGIGVLSAITNNNLLYKSLSGGGGTTVTESNGLIIISSATGAGSGTVTGALSAGGGLDVYQSGTSATLTFRTISGSNGFSAYTVNSLLLMKLQDNTINRVLFNNSGGTSISSSLLQLDATGNFFGLSGTSNTTRFLLPNISSGLISPIRFNKSSIAYTGSTDGDIWYSITGNTLKFNKSATTTDFVFKDNNYSLTGLTGVTRVVEVDTNGTLSASRGLVPFGVFNVISSLTISNSSSETSIISSQLFGSTTLYASTATTNQHLVAGKKFRFNARGVLSTNAIAPTLIIRTFIGTSAFTDSTAGTLTAALTNRYFEIDITFTIRAQGSSGKIIGSGNAEYTTGIIGTPNYIDITSLGEITIDTTIDKIFDCKITFGTADPANSLTITESTLEYLN